MNKYYVTAEIRYIVGAENEETAKIVVYNTLVESDINARLHYLEEIEYVGSDIICVTKE